MQKKALNDFSAAQNLLSMDHNFYIPAGHLIHLGIKKLLKAALLYTSKKKFSESELSLMGSIDILKKIYPIVLPIRAFEIIVYFDFSYSTFYRELPDTTNQSDMDKLSDLCDMMNNVFPKELQFSFYNDKYKVKFLKNSNNA